MRQFAKKVLAFVLTFAVVCSALPVSAEAAVSAQSSKTIYRTASSGVAEATVYVGGLSKTAKLKNIKSSNTKVVVPYYVNYTTHAFGYSQEYLDASMQKNNISLPVSMKYGAFIGLQIKKAGTATVSFRIGKGKKVYSTKVRVKPYENPLKTVRIAGIKNGAGTNLAGKIKMRNKANLRLTSTKKAVVSLTAKTGFKITQVLVYDAKTQDYTEARNYNGASSVSVNAGRFVKNRPYRITITCRDKTGTEISCDYYINYESDSGGYDY